jgi:hypothetical protein
MREAGVFKSDAPRDRLSNQPIFWAGDENEPGPLVTRRPKRVQPVSTRPSAEELAEWRAWAQRRNLSLSDLIRRTMAEVLEVEAAAGRADRAVVARVAKLSRLTPVEIEELRRRGGDVGDWPELDPEPDEGGEEQR